MSNPSDVNKEILEKFNAEAICDVCGHKGIVGVAASPFGPVSFAYCKECLNAGADHWGVITYAIWNAGGPKDCPEFHKKSLEATMKRTGKTEADLEARMNELRVEAREESLKETLEYLQSEKYSLPEVVEVWEKIKSFEEKRPFETLPEINLEEKPMPICCKPECGKRSEFEIYDKLDPEAQYTSTQSCEEHVGYLLGNCQHVHTDGKCLEWVVIKLEYPEESNDSN